MFKKVTFIGLLFCLFVTIGTSVFAAISVNSSCLISRESMDNFFLSKYNVDISDYDFVCTSASTGSAPAYVYFGYIPKSLNAKSMVMAKGDYIYFLDADNKLICYYNDSRIYRFMYDSGNYSDHSSVSSFYVLSNHILYDTTELDVYDGDGNLIHEGLKKEREILLNITYDDTYSKAIFSAEVLNAQDGDKLYYSTLIDARNNLINPIEMKYNSIYTVNASRNGMVFFQVIDSEGTTVCSESIYLKSLDGFTSDKFDISMESITASMYDYWVRVKGKYTDSIEGSYYDCYVSYTLSDTKNTYAGLNLDGLTNIDSEEARAYAQDTFYAFNPSIDFFDVHTTTKNVNVSVIFKFVNKETGYTCGYKRVDFVVSSAQNPLYPQYRFYF